MSPSPLLQRHRRPGFSPNRPSSARVSCGLGPPGPCPLLGSAATLARRAISLSVDWPCLQPRELGAAAFGAPWAPGSHPAGGDPRTQGRARGAPTHVALQFPLGGRLDEPAGAHGVARAHRGRCRRRFLQLGRPLAAGGSRARDADGAGPAPARPAPPRAAAATPASGRRGPPGGDGRHRPQRETAGKAGGKARGSPFEQAPSGVAGHPGHERTHGGVPRPNASESAARNWPLSVARTPISERSRQKGWPQGLGAPTGET